MRRLKQEIKQSQPFSSLQEEALLNVMRTADYLRRELQSILKSQGMTPTQYNALRILRGAGSDGLTCSELGNRLVSSDPDITRLLDRLVKQGLARRQRHTGDRRVVLTEITDEGRRQVELVTPGLDAGVRDLLSHIEDGQLEILVDLLEEVRQRPAASGRPEGTAVALETGNC